MKATIKSISFYTETRENDFSNDEELNKELQENFLNRCLELERDEDGFFYDAETQTAVFPNLLENESGFILKDAVIEVDGLEEEFIEEDDWQPFMIPPHSVTGKQITNFPDDFRFIQKCVFTAKEEK